MEIGKQQYSELMNMPVKRFEKYLDWKIKFDETVAKNKAESLVQI